MKAKFLAPIVALCVVCWLPVYAQNTANTSLSVIGTPDQPDFAKQIFPDAQPQDLLFAASDAAVRIGVRGHESTIQVTADGANVSGTLSVNGVPLRLSDKAPNGPCAKPEYVLSRDGVTVCDPTTHRYSTK